MSSIPAIHVFAAARYITAWMPGIKPGMTNKIMAEKNASEKSGERIAKVMARAGLCSRREAEAWIAAGRVAVNGKTIASPALDVTGDDRVVVDGKPLPAAERTRLFLYHKPRGLVTTNADPQNAPDDFRRAAETSAAAGQRRPARPQHRGACCC